MKAAKKLIGQVKEHPSLGKVKVKGLVERSRTVLEVECIDRGAGWCPDKKKYVGVRKPGGWHRGQNREYGKLDEAHYSALN